MTALPIGRGALPILPKDSTTSPTSSHRSTIDEEQLRTASRNRVQDRIIKPKNVLRKSPSTFDAATLSLIRRVLVPESPQNATRKESLISIEDVLPPLTSSNEVDIQLYAIIAIIVKDFVNTWYGKITPDHEFSQEIVQIIAHCSRAIEQRLKDIDVVELLLDDLAALVEQHIKAYRLATLQGKKCAYALDARRVYHSMNCHPALSPVPDPSQSAYAVEQHKNEIVYRQLLVNGVLACLLPVEDLQNSPLRILVGDIVADLIIGQVLAGKVCQGWFIHDLVSKIIMTIHGNIQSSPAQGQRGEQSTKSQLETFGLLHSDEQNISRLLTTKKRFRFSVWFWTFLQAIYLIIIAFRSIMRGLVRARNASSRSKPQFQQDRDFSTTPVPPNADDLDPGRRPVIMFNAFRTCSTLLRFADRMPWLQSIFAFLQHWLVYGSGRIATDNSILDRYLYDILTTTLLPPQLLPQILQSFRINVFPNNTLGPPAPPPPTTDEEKQAIRRKAAESIVSLIPQFVLKTYYNTTDTEEILEELSRDLLDVFADEYMNRHLVYGVLELIVVRLVPELKTAGVVDLLAEKGVFLNDHDDEASEIANVE